LANRDFKKYYTLQYLPIRFLWLTVFHHLLQFYFLPSVPFLSFSVFFSMLTFSPNWTLWSTTAPRQPQKDQKLFQLILLLVASKHCSNRKYTSFPWCIYETICLWYFLYPENLVIITGPRRSKTTGAAEQQGVAIAEYWLCNWYVSDICPDTVYFPWILIWRHWNTQFGRMVSLSLIWYLGGNFNSKHYSKWVCSICSKSLNLVLCQVCACIDSNV